MPAVREDRMMIGIALQPADADDIDTVHVE
jgi:hypothetical protein